MYHRAGNLIESSCADRNFRQDRFFKKIHLFYGLEEESLRSVADELEEISVPKGQVIFQQDSKAESFYLIYGGSVNIVRKQERKEIQLARLVRDDYFGEMALVSNRRRSGTATAADDTTLLYLSRKDFEKLFKRHSPARLNLEVAIQSRQLARRLQFKWLRPDEVVYFLALKHPIILYESLIVPVLALALPIGLLYSWLTFIPSFIVAFAGFGSLLAIVGWIVWRTIDWGNDYYIVTNQRAVWLEKVVGIYDSRQESPMSMVVAVGVESTPLGRALDYGNVIVRTYVGKIPFSHVHHPYQAARMIEEHKDRTREVAAGVEKEAMKNAIRRHLGIPVPAKPKTDSAAKPPVPPRNVGKNLLRVLGASNLKLRYETGDNVIYRKHWVVLILESWKPVVGTLVSLILFLYRSIYALFHQGVIVDTWDDVLLILFLGFLLWLVYEVIDWSNDKFEVTPEQIIDIDRKPFGTESRNAAQLDNILGTEYQRIGLLGNIFNYGTVYITVGGSKLAFEDVMDPATVQSDIDRRRAARIEKKNQSAVAAERERMAEWLATYHLNAEQLRKEEEKKNQKPG